MNTDDMKLILENMGKKARRASAALADPVLSTSLLLKAWFKDWQLRHYLGPC